MAGHIDADALTNSPIAYVGLRNLFLDKDNPRFGSLGRERVNQTDILDYIVGTFGVDDLLSSLSVNGYFSAEPLVCKSQGEQDSYVVAEGNRRLAACLILCGDERAKNQSRRTDQYREIHTAHRSPSVDPLPVIVYGPDHRDTELLSYLGVRHIQSAQPWDSYAKAVWVDRVVRETELTVEDVAEMIGDTHRTVARILEGYHFMQQLVSRGLYNPENSVRRGRGSCVLYPFSWVYTILGHTTVREFLNLGDNPSEPEPVPTDRLENAALITSAMFGDKSRGLNSALEDSRQLGELASMVKDRQKLVLLSEGKSLKDIKTITQPLDERLLFGLSEARETLRDLNNRLTEETITRAIAEEHLELSDAVRKLSVSVFNKLTEAAGAGI